MDRRGLSGCPILPFTILQLARKARFRRTIASAGTDERGNVALLFALLLPVFVGMSTVVIDIGFARSEHNRLLSVAEASALAAGAAFSRGGRDAAILEAKAYAGQNHPQANVVTDNDIAFGEWRDHAFHEGGTINAVRVTAKRSADRGNAVKTFVSSLIGVSSWDVSNSAIAMIATAPVCILVLHPTRYDAFDIDPDAQIDAPDCRVHINSDHHGALEIGSHALVNVQQLAIVGGYDQHYTASVSPTPITGAEPMADPYADMVPPVNDLCGGPDEIKDTTVTIFPTHAFCDGLTIDDADVTFSPGIYVIKDRFELENGATIRGDGVMIYLEGAGTDFFFHSQTSFNLSAPTSGPYAGIVLWSDKANTRDHDIYSKFGAVAEGTIYTPSSQVEFENNVVWEASCIRIVASYLELDNGSRYASTNTGESCSNNITSGPVSLVR